MDVPCNLALPFFAYGLFKPGQLGFSRIKDLTENYQQATISGQLYERDDLPLLAPRGGSCVNGTLLTFRPDSSEQAYQRIVAIEPDQQYRWDNLKVDRDGSPCEANVLVGKQVERGSALLDDVEWDGSQDPLFTSAMAVIGETIDSSSRFEWDLKPTFRLQMAYLLLWSAIERYCSLSYHLGTKAHEKVSQLAIEPVFQAALKANISEVRKMYSAAEPGDSPLRLDPQRPDKSLVYYYQVRCNMTHRGKAAPRDHDVVQRSLYELHKIFTAVLSYAFSA